MGGATPSPAARSQSDDQAYLEKLKQLSKYIDPLRRMIARIDKDESMFFSFSRYWVAAAKNTKIFVENFFK